jgi:hypothetical protein
MSNEQIEEIRAIQRLKYEKKKELESKNDHVVEQKQEHKIEHVVQQKDKTLEKHQEYLEKNNTIKNSYTECLCPEDTYPINQLDTNSESFIIIFSIFEDIPPEYVQKEIIDHFYDQINNSDLDNLYTFYISIKEISSTYDVIDIEIIFNTLNLIKMNYDFVKILDNKNKLEYIKIIFQEFIKIIDIIKPIYNLK